MMLFKNVTLYEEGAVRTEQFVRVDGKQIAYIGRGAPEPKAGEAVIDASGSVMLPGFANTHSHIPMTLLRGYGEGLPLERWLFEKMFPFEARLTPQDCYWGTALGLLEMIASGTVSYSDMYYNVEEIARATAEAGMKANIARGISAKAGVPSFAEHIGRSDTEQLVRTIRQNGWDELIKVDLSIHAEYTTDEKLVREVADYNRTAGHIMQVHVSETKAEHEACIARYGLTPTEYFSRCGLFDQKAVAAHCVHVTDRDIEILKAHDVTVAHCISSNLKLGSGIAPLHRLLAQGVRVTIGTDGAASNNNLNFMEEIHLTSLVHKGVTGNSLFLSPDEMLRMASRRGFEAQGRPESGRLAEGAAADLILVSLETPHMTPLFDIGANLVYSAQQSDVRLTMVNGRILYQDGQYLTLDEEKIRHMAHKAQRRVLAELEGGVR